MSQTITASVPPVAGAVLLGGQSRRMGCDKAALQWRGRTFLEIALTTLSPVASPLYLSGGAPARSGGVWVPDSFPGCGPLGGIYSVLSASPHPAVLIVGVDTPLLKTATLRRLINLAGEADVTVVRDTSGRMHPLCGLYRKACLEPVKALLERNELRVEGILSDSGLQVRIAEVEELACDESEFHNVNTPEDYERLCRTNPAGFP